MIHHVDKVDNSANLTEVRSIEDFWSILKAKAEAKILYQLEVRIEKCQKEVDQVTIFKTIGCLKIKDNDIRMFHDFLDFYYFLLT